MTKVESDLLVSIGLGLSAIVSYTSAQASLIKTPKAADVADMLDRLASKLSAQAKEVRNQPVPNPVDHDNSG